MVQTIESYANAAISNDSTILNDVHLKSKNIAIYERDATSLRKELDQISAQQIECRASGTKEEILVMLKKNFDYNLPDCTALFNDIANLLNLFEELTEASSFRLFLATINTNMCRRFHTDVNDLRLLCTYVGQGTIWLPDEAVNQQAVARGSNEEIVLDMRQIQQVNTGDVVVLKGALYDNANPIMHRSPSIEESGTQRLLLRIDTNDFLKSLT